MILGPKQYKAIELQYKGYSVEAIAEELNSSQLSVRKWQKDDDYKLAIANTISKQLGLLLPKAVSAVSLILDSDFSKPNEKLMAAKIVLDYYNQFVQPEVQKEMTLRIEYV